MLDELWTGPTLTACSLPRPRGELSEQLFAALGELPGRRELPDERAVAAADEDELQLALYCCYELAYGGFPGVDPEWEWEPALLALRRRLEGRFEDELHDAVGRSDAHPDEVVGELWRLTASGAGPSLSGYMAQNGTLDHFRELAVHRSAYQLKEADPHTWAIPRLRGEAKAVLVSIQYEEYGEGRPEAMHSALFADHMESLGLSPLPNAYLDRLPGLTLRTTNLISLFGLHRRLRGALVGHLALFEMTSTGPMSRYVAALARLGAPEPARRFFAVHVEADEIHERLATDGMVMGLLKDEPQLAGDVLFGAACLQAVEAEFARHLVSAFENGHSSLRPAPL